jgi:geranylgeranyl diphosphate synthase type I
MFQTYLQGKKRLLTASLHDFFKLQKPLAINRWGKDAIERLELFMQNGKMIRGALVFLGYDILSQHTSNDILLVAEAAELFQAGLLIHDDIMDNDELRRGKPSIHSQYANLMVQENARFPKNSGSSLAQCVGDATFFLGFQLLNQLRDSEIRQKLITLFSKELTSVCFSQMQDVYNGVSLRNATLHDILLLYQHKTGQYSIALPLMAGAILAGANKETLRHIDKFGADLGIAFQLTDDTLNMFGDPKITGKPIGSDIREGKQTPYLFYLRQEGISITDTDIQVIKKEIIEFGIDKKIQNHIQSYATSAREAIQRIPLPREQRDIIESLVDYLTHRIK